MSLSAQAKFLRVLQEREFQRLGGTRPLKANIRVIAATNRDLRDGGRSAATSARTSTTGCSVFEIQLPPLRDRRDDILPLSEAFLQEIGRAFGRPPAGMTREARETLLALRLARQRPRAAQRARARGHPLRRRAHHQRAPVAADRRAASAPAPPPARQRRVRTRVQPPAGDLPSMERAAIEQALTRHPLQQGEGGPAAGTHAHAALCAAAEVTVHDMTIACRPRRQVGARDRREVGRRGGRQARPGDIARAESRADVENAGARSPRARPSSRAARRRGCAPATPRVRAACRGRRARPRVARHPHTDGSRCRRQLRRTARAP